MRTAKAGSHGQFLRHPIGVIRWDDVKARHEPAPSLDGRVSRR